jgi:hypothetical protein
MTDNTSRLIADGGGDDNSGSNTGAQELPALLARFRFEVRAATRNGINLSYDEREAVSDLLETLQKLLADLPEGQQG